MEKIANSSTLSSDTVDILPNNHRAPNRTIGFDAQKNRQHPIRLHTALADKYSDIFRDIETLAHDYFDAAQKALQMGNLSDARNFIDEAMQLPAQFEMHVPKEFIELNAEILSKF